MYAANSDMRIMAMRITTHIDKIASTETYPRQRPIQRMKDSFVFKPMSLLFDNFGPANRHINCSRDADHLTWSLIDWTAKFNEHPKRAKTCEPHDGSGVAYPVSLLSPNPTNFSICLSFFLSLSMFFCLVCVCKVSQATSGLIQIQRSTANKLLIH